MGFLSLSPTRGEVWRGVKSGYIELTFNKGFSVKGTGDSYQLSVTSYQLPVISFQRSFEFLVTVHCSLVTGHCSQSRDRERRFLKSLTARESGVSTGSLDDR